MKKIIVLCLAIAIVACMGVTALAATGGFMGSPSLKPAPETVSGACQCGCQGTLITTAYGDREQLSEEAREILETACDIIRETEVLTSLDEEIAEYAALLGVDASALAVSDLFDLEVIWGEGHEASTHFDIVLEAEMLENFVCLLHYYDDAWHVVEGAKVTNNGQHLEFDVGGFSPFAIVVATEDEAPVEPDNSAAVIIIIAVLLVVAAGAAVFFVLKYKGGKADGSAEDGADTSADEPESQENAEAPEETENK